MVPATRPSSAPTAWPSAACGCAVAAHCAGAVRRSRGRRRTSGGPVGPVAGRRGRASPLGSRGGEDRPGRRRCQSCPPGLAPRPGGLDPRAWRAADRGRPPDGLRAHGAVLLLRTSRDRPRHHLPVQVHQRVRDTDGTHLDAPCVRRVAARRAQRHVPRLQPRFRHGCPCAGGLLVRRNPAGPDHRFGREGGPRPDRHSATDCPRRADEDWPGACPSTARVRRARSAERLTGPACWSRRPDPRTRS